MICKSLLKVDIVILLRQRGGVAELVRSLTANQVTSESSMRVRVPSSLPSKKGSVFLRSLSSIGTS